MKQNIEKMRKLIGENIVFSKMVIDGTVVVPHRDTVYTIDMVKNMMDSVQEVDKTDLVFYMSNVLLRKKTDDDIIKYHLGRIKHYVNNPNLITAITIDDSILNGIIINGYHRYIASIILGREHIEVISPSNAVNLKLLM